MPRAAPGTPGGMLAPWCELESAEPLIARLGTESIAWWRERFPGTVLERQPGGRSRPRHRRVGELQPPHRAVRMARRRAVGCVGARSARPLQQGAVLQGRGSSRSACRAGCRWLRGWSELRGADPFWCRRGGDAPACWGAPASARLMVDCTGLAAREVLTDLRGVKGEMLLLRLRDISLSRPVRVLHPRIPLVHRAARGWSVHGRRDDDRKRSGRRASARARCSSCLSAAYALHPAFGEAEIVEIGTGRAAGLSRQSAAHPLGTGTRST